MTSSARFEEDKFLSMKLNTAFALKKEKKYQEAEKILSDLLDEYQDKPQIKKSMADLMIKQKKLDTALLLVDEVLCSHPEDGESLILKGQIYYKRERYKEAKEWFREAVRHRKSSFPRHMLIKTMIRLNELDEANNLVDEALQKEGKNAYCMQLKGEILQAEDKTDEAIALYEQILHSCANDDKYDHKYIYKEVIKLKTQKMDRTEAVRQIDTLLKVSTYAKNEHLYIQQAENYKRQKKYAQAIEAYRKGLKVSPNNLFIEKQIGYCYNKLKKYEEVIASMKGPFIQDPKDYILRRVLFAAYKKLDKREELLEFIEEIGICGQSIYYALVNEAKK